MLHEQNINSYLNIRKKDYYDDCYSFFEQYNIQSVLDIGCATGDFAYCCDNNRISWTCIDIDPNIINHASNTRHKANITFLDLDFFDDRCRLSSQIQTQYESVSLLGTLGTLPNSRIALTCCLNYSEKLFIFHGKLNPYKFDVVVGHRNANSISEDYMFSHNTLSIYTFENLVESCGFEIIEFSSYVPNEKLHCDELSDSVKSFEIELNGQRALSNHLNMIGSEYLVIAKRK